MKILFWVGLWVFLWAGVLYLALSNFLPKDEKEEIVFRCRKWINKLRKDDSYVERPRVTRQVNESLRRFKETDVFENDWHITK